MNWSKLQAIALGASLTVPAGAGEARPSSAQSPGFPQRAAKQPRREGRKFDGGYFSPPAPVFAPVTRQEVRCEDLVIGGGPAGLAVGIELARAGRQVWLYERASGPVEGPRPGDASYNFTLVERSLRFLRRLGVEIDPETDAAVVTGRQVHSRGRFTRHVYGLGPADVLYSVPRWLVVSRLQRVAADAGVQFRFGGDLFNLDAREGVAEFNVEGGGPVTVRADRVFAADGAESRARQGLRRQAGCPLRTEPESFCYALGTIDPDAAADAGLRPDSVQIVPAVGSTPAVDIALPNADGSFSFLMERRTDRPLSKVGPDDLDLFDGVTPPVLRGAARDLRGQLLGAPVRRFQFTDCGRLTLGRTTLLGDAARVFPPHTGQGCNSGLLDAETLALARVHTGGDWDRTCELYQERRAAHAAEIAELTRSHGMLQYSNAFGSAGWRRADRLERLAERFFGRRSAYQRVVFDVPAPVFG